jgi:hypothetical protein
MELVHAVDPLLLDKKSVDALYDLLGVVMDCFSALQIEFVLVAGSALGCCRSRSLLFCDDDIDVAVIDADLQWEKVQVGLAAKLKEKKACFVKRPWPAADRIRLTSFPSVWIDVFVLRKYESMEALRRVICVKENGADQPVEYVERVLAPMVPIKFPLWHYDHRKAIELFPKEFFREQELYPIRFDLSFGPIDKVPMPAKPVPYLRRSYGVNVFEM